MQSKQNTLTNSKLNCNYYIEKKCSSCSLIEREISEIANIKLGILSNSLKENNLHENIENIVSLENPFNSRAKVKLSISGTVSNPIIGLVDRSLNTIELQNCPLHYKNLNSIIKTLPQVILDFNLTPYSIKKRNGELKGVILNSNSSQSEEMLRFILRSEKLIPSITNAVPKLLELNPNLKVISANIQEIPHQILEGEKEFILTDRKFIWDKLSNLYFAIGPKCFTQVTPEIASKLYSKVEELCANSKPQLVFDLFCGIGGFSMFSAKHANKVIGIEFSSESINHAKISADKNNINNIEFSAKDTEKFLSSYKGQKPDMVICNPPRRGLSKNIIDSLISLKPPTIIYSSCDPQTLSRDLKILNNKYKISAIYPFDMFPLTKHIETLAILVSN